MARPRPIPVRSEVATLVRLAEDTAARLRRLEQDRRLERAALDHDFDVVTDALAALTRRIAALEETRSERAR